MLMPIIDLSKCIHDVPMQERCPQCEADTEQREVPSAPIRLRYWLSRPLSQTQRDWCRRKEPDITIAIAIVLVGLALFGRSAFAQTEDPRKEYLRLQYTAFAEQPKDSEDQIVA